MSCLITMSQKELHRLEVIQKINDRRLSVVQAAELLGLPTRHYHQKTYVTCLDLGEAGALFTRGWNRTVELVGEEAKKLKRQINTVWIYPPPATRAAALASADPERVIDL